MKKLREIILEELRAYLDEAAKKTGLWANIAAKKKRMKAGSGEKKAKPGDEDYPETLDIDEADALQEKPAKGKAKQKVTASGKKVSYGQAGKAKDGGPRVEPGTSKGDAYCARSMGIKKGLSKDKQNDPNTPNNLSRKRWKCKGEKSTK